MGRTKTVIAAIIVVLVIVVVLQNTQAVETKLLFLSVTMPRALLLFVTLVVGFAAGFLAAHYPAGRQREAEEEDASESG